MKVYPGRVYKHFKGKKYRVVCIATHTETEEQMVIYQALYDKKTVYARPYDMFISLVDRKKYPDVKQVHRFELDEIKNKSGLPS